ncbi:MAG: hypothetical protein IKX17_07565, partial [Prevotella sp.]|nr:hypothetical protein [Prevotella sp.]
EIVSINGGTIDHNIFTSRSGPNGYYRYNLPEVNNSSITNNFFFDWGEGSRGSNCQSFNNCIGTGSWGDNPVVLDEGTTWDDVFYANKGVSIYSDYRLKGNWGKGKATDGTDIGIYGGSGFKKEALAPIPRIISKNVAESTDESGKLQIVVKVKAK